jgi:opacity protein-like surface antigen
MKRILAGVAVAVFSASLAIAADDPMQSRYDNTVTITNAKGEVTKLHYNKDGTVNVVLPDGSKASGKWALKDGKLCVTADAGPTKGKEQCNAFDGTKKVGDTWELAAPDGTKSKVAIVAGR